MDYSNEERENWFKSEKQVDNARLCIEHFVTGTKSYDLLHIDYVPILCAVIPVTGALRKRKVLIDMKDLRNMLETRPKKKKEKPLPRSMKQHFM